jgi:heterodisulfide reductase subunit C
MATKAYLMVKIKSKNGGDGGQDAVKELAAMPDVETVIPVSGEYDLVCVAPADTPKRVARVASELRGKEWVKDLHILKVEPSAPNPFLDEVAFTLGAETIRWCAQCGMCSASCPNVAQMDYSPRKVIALIRAGRRQDVLSSNAMWLCASCYMCTARCPRGVKITELMHALERLSLRYGLHYGKNTPFMNKAFLGTIRRNGRICEVSMMMKFYLTTIFLGQMNPMKLVRMLPVAFGLLIHRRMPIRAHQIKGREQLKTIMERARALGGAW